MQAVALLAATLTAGLMAGVYGIFALAIMPGLRTTDDRTFVAAFGAIDRAIVNPLFMLWFFGPLLFAGAAALLGGEALPWIVAALVLSLAVVVITFAVHLPLNAAIKDAGAVREQFHEARWVAWNLVRAVLSAAAFGCLAWALVEYGRL
jgi:uncharacterized membrane protein